MKDTLIPSLINCTRPFLFKCCWDVLCICIQFLIENYVRKQLKPLSKATLKYLLSDKRCFKALIGAHLLIRQNKVSCVGKK